MVYAQIAVVQRNFIVHEEPLVSELNKNAMELPTALILQMKQSAVSYNSHTYTVCVPLVSKLSGCNMFHTWLTYQLF